MTDNVKAGFDVLVQTELLRYMIPELYMLATEYEMQFNNMMTALQYSEVDVDSKWLTLLEPIGKIFCEKSSNKYGELVYKKYDLISKELASSICSRLKFSNKRTELILW